MTLSTPNPLHPDRIRTALTRLADPQKLTALEAVALGQTCTAALELVRQAQKLVALRKDNEPTATVEQLAELVTVDLPPGVTPLVVLEVALELRLWQGDLNMPAGYRKRLMSVVDRLWPPLAKEHEAFKASGGVL